MLLRLPKKSAASATMAEVIERPGAESRARDLYALKSQIRPLSVMFQPS